MINLEKIKKDWLKSEKNQQKFIGWDFSYLEGKSEMDPLPWDYSKLVLNLLGSEMKLLDMGTGGGELLDSLNHPHQLTSVTEGWEKNYALLLQKLLPLGVNVKFVGDDDFLDFPDDSFDIIINSHESFLVSEVQRVLKPGGYFITQQVGDINGVLLASKLIPDFQKLSFNLHLSTVETELKETGFKILYQNESYPKQKFYDMDGLIYYVRTIPWEFPNFTVNTHFDRLVNLNDELKRNGFVLNLEHRFVIVAQLNTKNMLNNLK
ncbi:methyltransferase domain-containing protein [Marinilactibacillus sp. GCM10026970]|uniref:methyltransferase domain-containing protein n=1 Tax=Marinilactibacillus sp. GCM10026970 TaxID=3252642 RepID=UPI0036135A92